MFSRGDTVVSLCRTKMGRYDFVILSPGTRDVVNNQFKEEYKNLRFDYASTRCLLTEKSYYDAYNILTGWVTPMKVYDNYMSWKK